MKAQRVGPVRIPCNPCKWMPRVLPMQRIVFSGSGSSLQSSVTCAVELWVVNPLNLFRAKAGVVSGEGGPMP